MVVVSPASMGLSKNVFFRVASERLPRDAWTSSSLLAPFVVVTAPMGMVLVRVLITFMVVLTVIKQLLLAAMVPPSKENEVALGMAVTVPPQVVVGRVGAARYMPAGKESVNSTPVNTALLGFVRVSVRVEEAPPKTVFGEKLLFTLILRSATVMEALAATGLEML